DLSPESIADGRQRVVQQVRRATGQLLDGAALRGFTNSYCSSLIHDINAVHGLLDVMGIATGKVIGAAFFAGGDAGHGSRRLKDRDAIWQMTHLFVPHIADYRERVSLYFDDCLFELTFPSPYLNHFPTRLHVSRSDGNVWQRTEYRAGYEEAFIRELI